MNKLFVWAALLIFGIGGAWYWYQGRGSGAALHPDLYPLYTGVTWGEVQAVSTERGPAYQMQSQPFTDVVNLGEKFVPFEQYYQDKLVKAGWTQDIQEEASGPGSEISVYRKGDQFIVVSYQSTFKVKHADAPSECPCDITFTLASGTQVGPTRAQQQAMREYHDQALDFSLTLPTAVATAQSDADYSVDPSYEYTAFGPGKSIAGVKFSIPKGRAAGTNLSDDTYVSVEHLPAGASCTATAFLDDPRTKAKTLQEGAIAYSAASSTGAAVGNRYEEWVYARKDSPPAGGPCIAVRYFIHYAAIENFPEGTVREFDRTALLQEFDQIRRTLRLAQ